MKKKSIYFLLMMLTVVAFAQNQKPSIVAMDFYCEGIFVKSVSISAATVTTALRNTEMFDVISVEDRNTILRIKNYIVEECLDPVCQSRAAKALGVNFYLCGDIRQVADKYIFHMSILDAQTGVLAYESEKSFDDFGEMLDSLKVMVYEICGIEPVAFPQEDVKVVKKPVKRKISAKEIALWSVISSGAVATIVGGFFLLDANNYYYQKYQPALEGYRELVTATPAEFDKAFSLLQSNKQNLVNKIMPGIIVTSAGAITLLTGVVVLLIPEQMNNDSVILSINPIPAGLGFFIKY